MVPSGKGFSFLLGLLIALGLVSAPLGRFLLPMFQWFLLSARDVMLVWFILIAVSAVALLAWRITPGLSWLLMASLASAWLCGFRGDTLTNVWMLVGATSLLLLMVEGWTDHREHILFGLLVGVLANVAVAIMQAFVSDLGIPAPAGLVYRDPFFAAASHVREIEGFATHYSLLIAVLVISLPLIIQAYRFGWILLMPTTYFIWFAGHRSGAIALFALLLLAPIRWRKLVVITVLIFVAVIVYMRGSFSSGFTQWSLESWTGWRASVWVTTAAKATQKPWFGWGPGSFAAWMPTFFHEKARVGLTFLQAHNEYLQTYFDVGVVGLAGVPVWFGHLVWRLRKVRPWSPELRAAMASTLALAFIAFCSFPFRIGVTSFVAIVTMAALHGELRRVRVGD